MKILVDTNVILDVLCNRPDYADDSLKIWKYCEIKQIYGYVSALSVANIVYILRKELTPQKTAELISQISMIFEIIDLKYSDMINAAEMYLSDYEDAVQMCCADRINADYIVTRNIRDFKNSSVVALSPSELLRMLQ